MVCLDVGLGFFVEMTLAEAIPFLDQKETLYERYTAQLQLVRIYIIWCAYIGVLKLYLRLQQPYQVVLNWCTRVWHSWVDLAVQRQHHHDHHITPANIIWPSLLPPAHSHSLSQLDHRVIVSSTAVPISITLYHLLVVCCSLSSHHTILIISDDE